jgi:cytochrome oxidase Cu insertion factor (SCO1/SenC/PrrC family)
MTTPVWHLVTGDPAAVDRALDALGVERRVDPDTGVIDHTNLFVLIDRAGRVAYRLTPGDREARWLEDALHLLLAEAPRGS